MKSKASDFGKARAFETISEIRPRWRSKAIVFPEPVTAIVMHSSTFLVIACESRMSGSQRRVAES
jgi:hypothetical protein